MKLLKQINLMDDQKTIKRLNLAAIPALIFFLCLFYIFNSSWSRSN